MFEYNEKAKDQRKRNVESFASKNVSFNISQSIVDSLIREIDDQLNK